MGIFKRKPDIEKMEQEKDIKGLIDVLARENDLVIIEKVADALGRIGKPALEQLVQTLGHKKDAVRFGAEKAIVRLATKDIRPFGEMLEQEGLSIESKRNLMKVLQKIPGLIRGLSTYRIPPLGT